MTSRSVPPRNVEALASLLPEERSIQVARGDKAKADREVADRRSPVLVAQELRAMRSSFEQLSGAPLDEGAWQVMAERLRGVHSLLAADEFAALTDDAASSTYWRRIDGWTVEEAALLLVGVDPRKLERRLRLTPQRQQRFTVPAQHTPLIEFLTMAAMVGRLKFPARPADVVRWAVKDHSINVPRPLRDLARARTGDSAADRQDFTAMLAPLWATCANQKEVLDAVESGEQFERYRGRYKLSTIKTWVKATDPRPKSQRSGRPRGKG